MTRETVFMGASGLLSAVSGTKHYLETNHLDLMSVVFLVLSVLYFVSLLTSKEES
jgi:hypothetical protein